MYFDDVLVSCRPCPQDHYCGWTDVSVAKDQLMRRSEKCPEGFETVGEGHESREACVCEANTVTDRSRAKVFCKPCREIMLLCPNPGTEEPSATHSPNYWRQRGSFKVHDCDALGPALGACVGGLPWDPSDDRPPLCRKGHTGPKCRVCAQNHYLTQTGCRRCAPVVWVRVRMWRGRAESCDEVVVG